MKGLRILVTRVDRLGDFCHTLPALSVLRRSLPDARIDLMMSKGLVSLTEEFSFYDGVLGYESVSPSYLREQQYSHALVLNHHSGVVDLLTSAGIPVIFGQKRGLGQWRYTHKTRLFRSKCTKAEWRYCVDHVESFLAFLNVSPADLIQRDWDMSQYRDANRRRYLSTPDQLLVFVHPGTGGSEPTLCVSQFAELIYWLDEKLRRPKKFLFTYSPEEIYLLSVLENKCVSMGVDYAVVPYKESLSRLLRVLSAADVFISGSTGTLHLASLHNPITAGFYTRGKRNLQTRWSSLSDSDRRLSFTPEGDERPDKPFESICLEAVASKLVAKIERVVP